jgi:hypothetical protein
MGLQGNRPNTRWRPDACRAAKDKISSPLVPERRCEHGLYWAACFEQNGLDHSPGGFDRTSLAS